MSSRRILIGIAIVAFPVYLAIVASTQDNALIANGQMSLLPGGHFFDVYYKTIVLGTSGSTREPVGVMLLNSLIMALTIALQLTGLSFGLTVPMVLVQAGYMLIGWQAGVAFTRDSLRAIGRVLPPAIGLISLAPARTARAPGMVSGL